MTFSPDFESHDVQLLEAVGALVSEPFFIVDTAETLKGCNASALQAAGVPSLERLQELGDARLTPLFVEHAECFVPSKAGWMRPLGERTPKVAFKGEGDASHMYRLHVQPVVLGGETYYLVYLADIEMFERAKRAEQYFETFKQQFLTNISHEFRTPMNAIIGFSGLLEQTHPDKMQSEYIVNIQKSATTMLENIENLLDLMQIESGTQKPRREAFAVFETFELFFQRFCPMAEEKGVAIFFMLDPQLPASMVADSELIKKVLRNLITNAIKFTTTGGQVLVDIKVVKAGSKPEIRYSVTDTGEGIAKQKLQTLLRPFAASRENRLRGKDGFGVGLTLAFKLLKLLGSELSVASEVGKGSRFSFSLRHPKISPSPFTAQEHGPVALWCEQPGDIVQLRIMHKYLKRLGVEAEEISELKHESLQDKEALFMISPQASLPRIESLKQQFPDLGLVPVVPAVQEEAFLKAVPLIEDIIKLPILPSRLYHSLSILRKHAPNIAEQVTPQPEVDASSTTIRRILVAEDNVINQKLITTILKQAGYDVTTADNGKIAADCYETQQFDVVLMDIDMPVMDGISATRVLREIDRRDRRPFTPVIALTARALAGDRERIIGAGLDAHLSKPVDREFLLLTLEQYLKMKDERNRKGDTGI